MVPGPVDNLQSVSIYETHNVPYPLPNGDTVPTEDWFMDETARRKEAEERISGKV